MAPDAATLTGAAVVALGEDIAAAFETSEGRRVALDEVKDQLRQTIYSQKMEKATKAWLSTRAPTGMTF